MVNKDVYNMTNYNYLYVLSCILRNVLKLVESIVCGPETDRRRDSQADTIALLRGNTSVRSG